ncbi:MAG: hypothetical protein CUN53_05570 [Phototrophicales bacterium]|nr:MAG: hypothetical protein CUN53_05570 [Phototrophicales bacterium]
MPSIRLTLQTLRWLVFVFLYTVVVFEPGHRRALIAMSEKILVLVAEDDTSLRQIICESLSQIGLVVLEAKSGTEALKLLTDKRPNIVLLDMRLPQISGEEILEIIYAHPDYARTRVIVLTASATFDPRILRPDDQYLMKPVPMSSILAVVRDFLSDLSVCSSP